MRRRAVVILLALVLLSALVLAIAAQRRLPAGVTRGKIKSAELDRTYLLYVPESYDPATPAPLVISMHGFASWPANQMSVSQWNELAVQQGFIVVYPSGTGFPKRWNTSGRTSEDAADDVAFLSDLIDTMSQQFNIDPARIYANGFSNGAGMANLLACELSDRIAAIGGVAGAYSNPAKGCEPFRPVPVIAFHGTADPIVPYAGGAAGPGGFVFPAVPDWAAAWAQRNGCDETSTALPVSGEVSGVRYANCDENAGVIFYTVVGGGHSWTGGGKLPKAIVGHTPEDINATAVMWEFFTQHALK